MDKVSEDSLQPKCSWQKMVQSQQESMQHNCMFFKQKKQNRSKKMTLPNNRINVRGPMRRPLPRVKKLRTISLIKTQRKQRSYVKINNHRNARTSAIAKGMTSIKNVVTESIISSFQVRVKSKLKFKKLLSANDTYIQCFSCQH